jgi:hypothetical protein
MITVRAIPGTQSEDRVVDGDGQREVADVRGRDVKACGSGRRCPSNSHRDQAEVDAQ